jgi:hypothetical protein
VKANHSGDSVGSVHGPSPDLRPQKEQIWARSVAGLGDGAVT